jgi:hypothetical protein
MVSLVLVRGMGFSIALRINSASLSRTSFRIFSFWLIAAFNI